MIFKRKQAPHAPITVDPPIFDTVPPLYIVYPHAVLPGSQAPKFTTISGRFAIDLKEPETLTEIVAKLVPRYFAHHGSHTDSGQLSSIPCRIQAPGRLEAGRHELPFVFDLPCTSWHRSHMVMINAKNEYGIQTMDDDDIYMRYFAWELHFTRRMPDGSTSIYVDEFPNRDMPFKAIALSHPGESTRLAKMWRESYHVKTFVLVSSPSDPGELPPPLERVIEEWAPQSGPINLILTSRCFTVGSLLNINLVLPDVPTSSTITRIRGLIIQYDQWKSPRQDGPSWQFDPIRMTFLNLAPPFERTGNTVTLATSARLPDDRFLSPSTLKFVQTPLPIHHEFALEIEVTDEKQRKKLLTVKTPVVIAHCMLISELLHLPRYGDLAQPRSKFQPERLDERYCCACGFTMAQLIERESEGILPDEALATYEVKARTP